MSTGRCESHTCEFGNPGPPVGLVDEMGWNGTRYAMAVCAGCYEIAKKNGTVYRDLRLERESARIEAEYQERVARGEVPAGYRRS